MTKILLPKHVYHGTTADPLDILLHGLEARDDRDGISVSTSRDRARWWAGLKRGDVYLLRIPTGVLSTVIPETARPADPRYDFTVDKLISPVHLEVQDGRKWIPMAEAYSEVLLDEELEEWKRKWLP
jgi:hypothetical protein